MKNYTYEECLRATEEYFQGDDLPAKVFVDKYALRNNEGNILESTPDEMHRRLAKEFARIESKYPNPLSENEIFSYLDRFSKIIPQGSPMAGIGNPYQIVSLSNCEVIAPPEDSYGGICLTDQELAQLQKRRCGVGFDISTLRPKGLPTKNSARTTDGIAIFMERFSNTTREVAQNGRRGALLLSISVHHPEIETFIKIKRDLKKVTGANISIRYSDEFLRAVENDTDFELRFPVDYKEKNVKPLVSKYVNAKYIWDQMVESNWSTSEPGSLYWDTIIRLTPSEAYASKGFKTCGMNPCLPSWATVLTPHGISTIGKINIGDLIWSETGWTKVTNKFSNGIKDVNAYHTTFGIFYGTEDHHIVQDGIKVEVCNAEGIDLLRGYYNSNLILDNQAIMDGIVLGDGSVHKASNNLVHLCIGKNDQDYFESEIANLILKHRPGIVEYAYEIQTNITWQDLPLTYFRKIPERYLYGTPNIVASFLRGLYSANGSLCGGRVTLKAASLELIQGVQVMLSSLGIASYYTTNKPSNVKFTNGEYLCKQSYDLNITIDRDRFYNSIGFIQKYKTHQLESLLSKQKGREVLTKSIKSTEFISSEEVFDITVDNIAHTYWTGGLNVSNCAELVLSAYDSCRLLLQNTCNFVINPFLDSCNFDWESFKKSSYISQKLMDDIVDLELEHIDKILEKIESDPESEQTKKIEKDLWLKIRENCYNGRRTGTGLTSIGDCIAGMNLKYGSDSSIEFIGELYKQFCLQTYHSSVDMARDRGAFPVFEYELEKDHPFLNQIWDADPELKEKYLKYGRRNIANTTTPPAGSTSIVAQLFNTKYHNTTSSMESCYLISYIRRKKINAQDTTSRVDFTDHLGDKWSEYKVYHSGFQYWKEITGKTDEDIKESPYWGATSNDIDWLSGIKLQAAAQKWICHSISRTANIPKEATKELVSQIYLEAWKAGCKGYTVYRDGSRSGVLISNEDNKGFKKRPKELNSDIYHVIIKGKPHTILISLMDNQPYELLVIGDKIKNSLNSGKIIKHKKGHYDLYDIDNNLIYENITSSCTSEEGNITRFVSMLLRHNVKPDFIYDQLNKSVGEINSFAKSIGRSIKKYIPQGTEMAELCPECSEKLVKEGMCFACKSCGYSKC